jgi:hypothetical protein
MDQSGEDDSSLTTTEDHDEGPGHADNWATARGSDADGNISVTASITVADRS